MFWLCFFSLSWNSFIENFGTHIIVSVTIGGKDVIYVKQHQSSPLSKVEIKNYVQDIGNQRFSTRENHTTSGLLKYKDKASSAILLLCFYRIFSLKSSPAFALCLWLLTNPLSLSLSRVGSLINFAGSWPFFIQQPRGTSSAQYSNFSRREWERSMGYFLLYIFHHFFVNNLMFFIHDLVHENPWPNFFRTSHERGLIRFFRSLLWKLQICEINKLVSYHSATLGWMPGYTSGKMDRKK